jgi:hypothetical protein
VARRRLLQLRRASGCFGTSRGLSRDSSSTTSPRAGSSSTTSPTLRIWVPRHVTQLVTRLVVDYFASAARPGASARRAARRRLLRVRRASGCFSTSRGSSRGSSSTTSPPSRIWVPRLVARLVVDYFVYATRPVASAHHVTRRTAHRAAHRRLLRLAQACRRLRRLHRASGCLGTPRGSSSTTLPPSRIRVPRHVTWLVIDNFDYTARPVASARRAARRVARRRLLLLRHAYGCLDSSRVSSSTTSTMSRIRVLRHVAWHVARLAVPLVVDYFASRRLVVDYFAYAARPGASARRAARLTARHRLLRLHRTFECLGTSRGSSHGSSLTTPCAATSSCSHTGSTSATPCVATTCLVATLALLQLRRTPPRRRLLVASRRPFISTSFPN